MNIKEEMSNPIFIVGLRRSGTTLLNLMLNAHSKIHITYESGFLPKFYNHKEKYGDLSHIKNQRKLLEEFYSQQRNWSKDDYPPINDVISNIKETTMDGIFSSMYELIANKYGKSRWGDKTPDFVEYLEVLSKMFPDAQFIHIIRDCRDIILSRQSLKWFRHDIRIIAKEWSNSIKLGEEFSKTIDSGRYKAIKYEDIICEPRTQLKNVCDFLGEEFEEQMLEFYKESKKIVPSVESDRHQNTDKGLIKSNSEKWRHKMNSTDICIVESIIGNKLNELDYKIVNTDSNWSKILVRNLYYDFINLMDRLKGKKV